MQQGNLILNPNKGNPKLKDLYIRPSITQRRSPVGPSSYGIAGTSNTVSLVSSVLRKIGKIRPSIKLILLYMFLQAIRTLEQKLATTGGKQIT